MTDTPVDTNLIDLTADIVSAYVSNNTVASTDLPVLINEVYGALQKTATASNEPEPEPLKPAVPIKKSVMPDYIVCLEDGKKFKSLKRHLRTHYNMTPEEYRDKWD
ncbi:MAG: MucR family transcriptional regulator, partial [Hyphomicrobiales bacterium]